MQERMCEEFGAREAQCYKEEWKVIQHQLEQVVRYWYALGPEHPDLTVYIATRHTRRLPDTSTPQDRPRATIPHGDIQCHPFCL